MESTLTVVQISPVTVGNIFCSLLGSKATIQESKLKMHSEKEISTLRNTPLTEARSGLIGPVRWQSG